MRKVPTRGWAAWGQAFSRSMLKRLGRFAFSVPFPAPVGFIIPYSSFPSSAVNRRFPGVSAQWLEGWRTRGPAFPSLRGLSLSEPRDLGDLVHKLQATEIAINLLRDTPTSCEPRPAAGRVWDRKTALSAHGIATRRGPRKHSGHSKHRAAPCLRRMTFLD